MNRAIRRVTIVAGLLIMALLVNATAAYLFRYQSLNNDPQNRRVQQAQFGEPRGAILAGNTPIASTAAATGDFAYLRTYADGPLYAPVTGFYSFIYGRSKLDQAYNAALTGTSNSQAISQLINSLTNQPPAVGSVQTTINPKAQQAAWNALKGLQGAVVAMDYSTGAILAYVSAPSYDPAQLSSGDLKATQEAWASLNADPAAPMSDRAGREIYPPGSTFKLVTAAAALEAGWTPDTMVASPDKLTLPGTNTQLGNVEKCGGDQISLQTALQVSCNTAFANVGLSIGQDAIAAQADKFGFGSSFGGDVNSVTSSFPTGLNDSQTAMSAIGQYDVTASPLQMAVVAAAIANNGLVMQPYFVSEVRGADLSPISRHTPVSQGQAVSANTAQELQQMMRAVVAQGTGTRAQVPGLTIGGKTGTAQSDNQRAPYAWFIGYAAELHVAICVFVENSPTNDDQFGGTTAAPIFRKVVQSLQG